MKTSLVLTLYNGAEYLIPLLDSLSGQTRPIDEVLIFDDSSTDNSVELVQKYIEDNHLHGWYLYINKENLGWERNFTQGLMAATGDIVFPCDQDDIWHLDKVEKMTNAFEKNADILLLVSDYHAFSDDGARLPQQQVVLTETCDLVSRVAFDEHYYVIRRPGCTMAMQRDILPIFHDLWNPGTPHDALLWMIASIQHRLYLYDDTFIEFRRHASNASRKIAHGYQYKVNEISQTLKVNDYFLASNRVQDRDVNTIKECSKWCDYREKLIVEKKRRYWFKLFLYRRYYFSIKKYVGDIYYSFQHADSKVVQT